MRCIRRNHGNLRSNDRRDRCRAYSPSDYAAFARACGGTGFRVEAPEDVSYVLEQALAAPGPVIVDAIVDPYEPVTPPRLSEEQKKHYEEALQKGQPHRAEIEHSSLGEKAHATTTRVRRCPSASARSGSACQPP